MKRLLIPIFVILFTSSEASSAFSAPAPLSADEAQALQMAIDDEYKARATYRNVIKAFGEIRPFSNIINAEERHIEALESLFEYYDQPIPQDRWDDKVPMFNSRPEACQAGIKGEEENIRLYEDLLVKTDAKAIRNVFLNLQNASSKHLRAFKRCAG
jgi:hypothetical protein